MAGRHSFKTSARPGGGGRSLKDLIKAKVAAFDAYARPWASANRFNGAAYEFLMFGLKEAWACLFGAVMLVLLVGSHLLYPKDAILARYDFLALAALAVQATLLALRLERWDEAIVILIFHVVGTAMELFKTAHGSWVYPEHNLLRIGGVPLFSGFMYACIGSYLARAWRLLEVRFVRYPPIWSTWVLGVLSYLNFFTHHFAPDMRLGLFGLSVVLFGPAMFEITPDRTPRRLPMVAGFVMVAMFIWFAENLGTFAGAWIYPSQRHGWTMVSPAKIGSWYLLMILSFVLVSIIHRPQPALGGAAEPVAEPAAGFDGAA